MSKPKCQYCKVNISLSDDNHIIGCNLEAFANVLMYRGYEKESRMLDEIASRIK